MASEKTGFSPDYIKENETINTINWQFIIWGNDYYNDSRWTGERGEVEKVDVWGMRKLAYPINKKEEGYYVVVDFKGNPTLPKELDRRLKISDNVIRHIILSKDEK